jgi:hypothetical protein
MQSICLTMPVTCPIHVIVLNLIALTTSDDVYKLCSSSLRSFLLVLPLRANYSPSTLLSNTPGLCSSANVTDTEQKSCVLNEISDMAVYFTSYVENTVEETRMKQSPACYLLHANLLLGLPFDPEDVGDMFLRNVGWLAPEYTALHPLSITAPRT